MYASRQRAYDLLLALSSDLGDTLDCREIVGRLLASVRRAIPVSHCALLTSDGAGTFRAAREASRGTRR
jgi:hypothetical protein